MVIDWEQHKGRVYTDEEGTIWFHPELYRIVSEAALKQNLTVKQFVEQCLENSLAQDAFDTDRGS